MKNRRFFTIVFVLFSFVMGGAVIIGCILAWIQEKPHALVLILLPIGLWISEYFNYKKRLKL